MHGDGDHDSDRLLKETLRYVARALRDAQDRWWIIGSAAMRLHGAETTVADVDVLLSAGDARMLAKVWEIDGGSGDGTGKFRSEVFFRRPGFPLTVEVMGGFEVRSRGHWRPVVPAHRLQRACGTEAFYLPSLRDLITMCQVFDRPKDIARMQMLRELER